MSHLVDAHVAYIKTISDLNNDKAELLERIKRLEEAGKELRECASWVGHACCEYADKIRRAEDAVKAWDKEAKP